MCKKLLIAALAVVVGVGVVSGTRLGSHFRLWYTKSSHWAKEQVPPEVEIDRLKMELENLARLDDRFVDEVARQKIEVKKLETDVTGKKVSLARTESFLRNLRAALAEKGEFVSVNGSEYARDKAQREFELEFKQFLAAEKCVKADDEVLTALKSRLSESEQRVAELGTRRAEMKARLQTLAAHLERERRLQAATSVVVDGNRYSALNKQLDELQERIDAMGLKREMKGTASPQSIRAQEEAKVQQKQLDKLAEERFGAPAPKVASK